jgi:catechol 2,3-dioxygenase-like lactoylglutathione lyase family enzyme
VTGRGVPVTGVSELVLEVVDLEAAEEFYAGVLGLPVVDRWPDREAIWVMAGERTRIDALPNEQLNAIFEATVDATEEAILNSLIAAETMVGADYLRVHALPHDRLREILARYNRLQAEGQ